MHISNPLYYKHFVKLVVRVRPIPLFVHLNIYTIIYDTSVSFPTGRDELPQHVPKYFLHYKLDFRLPIQYTNIRLLLTFFKKNPTSNFYLRETLDTPPSHPYSYLLIVRSFPTSIPEIQIHISVFYYRVMVGFGENGLSFIV